MVKGDFYFDKVKRLDKLGRDEREQLVFDLINAFAIVRSPTEAALLLHDLLTKWEINNLSKRLAIAKSLLKGKTHEEIVRDLHCGFGTVVRVSVWLNEGGQGLKKVIGKLPKRTSEAKPQRQYPSPNLPLILLATFQELKHRKETKTINEFLNSLEEKHLTDKQIKEMVAEKYRYRLKKEN